MNNSRNRRRAWVAGGIATAVLSGMALLFGVINDDGAGDRPTRSALRVPMVHPTRSCGMPVFVEGSAESVSSVDFRVAGLLGEGDRSG